jgi:hypothetical protein
MSFLHVLLALLAGTGLRAESPGPADPGGVAPHALAPAMDGRQSAAEQRAADLARGVGTALVTVGVVDVDNYPV